MTGRLAQLGTYLRRIPSVVATVLRNRELRAVTLAFAAFNALEWGTWIAMIVFAYGQGGATTAGIVAFVQLVPAAIVAPIAAVLGDRHRAGRVLALGYLAQATAVLATAGALILDASPYVVYAFGIAAAISVTLTRPPMSALLPSLARTPIELTSANVVAGWMESLTVLVAPALTGLVLGVWGAGVAFLLLGLLGAVAFLLVLPVPGPQPAQREEATGAFEEVAAGLGVLRAEKAPRILIFLLAGLFLGMGALDVLYAELAIGALEAGNAWAGYLNAAFGLGGALGVAATIALVGRRHLLGPITAGVVLWAGALALLAIVPTKATAFVGLALAGVACVVVDVAGRTLLQRSAPGNLLARVFGLLEGVSMAALALGAILVPALTALGGTAAALLGTAAILPLIALATWRHLRTIDQDADVPVVAIGLLRTMPLFAPLSAPAIEGVARQLVPVEVEAGVAVVTQGEDGDRWYAIADGTLEVRRDDRVLATIGRGEGFGEIALLRNVPRTATVTALTSCSLYALEKEAFTEAITGHPEVVVEAERVVDRHLATH